MFMRVHANTGTGATETCLTLTSRITAGSKYVGKVTGTKERALVTRNAGSQSTLLGPGAPQRPPHPGAFDEFRLTWAGFPDGLHSWWWGVPGVSTFLWIWPFGEAYLYPGRRPGGASTPSPRAAFDAAQAPLTFFLSLLPR